VSSAQERVMASSKLDENEREALERSAYLSKGSRLGLEVRRQTLLSSDRASV
jgi:hypothetical protein